MCDAGDVPLRIVNLKPSTAYLLRVRAVNDVGAGTPVVRTQLTENIRACVPCMLTSFVSSITPADVSVLLGFHTLCK